MASCSGQGMSDHLKTHPLFRQMTEEQEEDMMDGIEKHLMTNIYTKWVEFVGGVRPYSLFFFSCVMYRVFSPASSDDEMKDLLLQRRFRMLNWLEPHHLDVPLNLQNPEVQEQIIKGQQGRERERERERKRERGGGGEAKDLLPPFAHTSV